MSKKTKDPIVDLLQEAVDTIKKDKTQFVGLALGAAIGYCAHRKLEDNPQVRDGLLGAVSGETIARLLGAGKMDTDRFDTSEFGGDNA